MNFVLFFLFYFPTWFSVTMMWLNVGNDSEWLQWALITLGLYVVALVCLFYYYPVMKFMKGIDRKVK